MVYNNLYLRTIFSLLMFSFFSLFYFFLTKFLIVLIAIIYITICYEILKNFKFYKLQIFCYLIVSFSFISFYLFNFYDKFIFLIFILIIFLFDTFSYFSGKTFGKIKILPKISPNKTLEGSIGGFIATLVFVIMIYYFFNKYNFLNLIFFNSTLVILAFLGDFAQSFLKRKSNIKNSSNLIPGHGGLFDRMDGYLMGSFLLPFQEIIL